MAEEAEHFVRSVQYDAATNAVVGVDATMLTRLRSSLMDAQLGSSMIASHSQLSTTLPAVLVSVINSSTVSTKSRLLALEVMVALSRTPDTFYRRDVLFPAVANLDASFEGLLLDREEANRNFGTSLGRPHEHMVVLLFRVAGYDALKAADLLQQLCSKDDVMLASILLNIIRIKSYEWELISAALRCFFELTLPQTYFTASDDNSNNVVAVNSFQQKITTLLVHAMQGNTLKYIGDELTERWSVCASQSPDMINGVLHYYATAMKYFTGMLLNMEDFTDQAALRKTYQQSLLVQLGSSMTGFLVSFVETSLQVSRDLLPIGGPSGGLVVSAILASLRVLRMAFYKPSRGIAPHLVRTLQSLLQTAINRLVVLRQAPLVPALLLILEIAANADAASNPELDPLLRELLSSIAADDSRTLLGGFVSLSQTLSTLFLNESSIFVVMENETTRTITAGLCGAALDDLVDEIIQYIDKELVCLGLGPAVFEFFIPNADPQDLVFVPTPVATEAIPSGASGVGLDGEVPEAVHEAAVTNVEEGSVARRRKREGGQRQKKSPHPKEFLCMLTGKLMREPVIIRRTGNRYELEALEKVISEIGHVDPLTYEAFDEDPEIDIKLQQAIQQYKVLRAAEKKRGANAAT